MICRDCAVIEHKDHKQTYIDKVANMERANLKQLIMQIQIDVNPIEKSLSKVIEMMKKIEKKCGQECEKVEKTAKELKYQIDQRATKLLNEIKDLKKMKLKNLELQKEYLSRKIAAAKINDIEFVERSDDIQLLDMKKQLNQKHCELQKALKKPVFIEHRDAFEVHLEKELLVNIGRWGSIVDSGLVSVEDSVISGVTNKATVDKETHFSVQLRTKDGKIVHVATMPICAMVNTMLYKNSTPLCLGQWNAETQGRQPSQPLVA